MIGFVMLALGGYRFAVTSGGYERMKRKTAWRWPGQDLIGARPQKQFMGPGEDSITIEGTIFPHFRGGLRQVPMMRAEAGRGVPLNLTDGLGDYWGRYVITSIEEGKEAFLGDGAPRKIDFTIELEAY